MVERSPASDERAVDSLDRETLRVRRTYEKQARRYDKQIGFWERRLLEGGRQWVCSRAAGDVLEIGIGTGRNLPLFAQDVRLVGIELSPSMLAIARERANRLRLTADLRVGMRRPLASRARASTR